MMQDFSYHQQYHMKPQPEIPYDAGPYHTVNPSVIEATGPYVISLCFGNINLSQAPYEL